ncbi:MAG: DUF4153 domain-containing protein [Bacteroidales bacterium]|nr:DUF4153 domain-containing protein [Bacteroidales bacterium]
MSNFKNWFKSLLVNFSRVFKRYPATCFFSAALTLLVIDVIITDQCGETWPSEKTYISCGWGLGLAMVLSMAFELFCTIRKVKLWQRLTGTGIIVAIAAVCTCGCLFEFLTMELLFAMAFAAVLCVLLAFSYSRNAYKVWNYHAKLLVALLIACILCDIIATSIAGITATIEILFNPQMYFLLQISLAFTFIFLMACCTLALMPTEEEAYSAQPNPHKLIRFLMQYILLPLICIEGIILYIYGITILVHWELPEGGIVGLVFSYAIIGSFIWYLLMPYFLSEEKQWVRFFHRGFFISLLPLLVLLFVGLFRRISDYGLTTNRYIVFVISAWFAVISIIFSIKKIKNVTPLLLSLLVVTLLTMLGPWSMNNLPDRMQTARFEKLATEYGLLKDGHIVAAEKPLNEEQCYAMSNCIDYFTDYDYRYTDEFMQKYFNMSEDECKELAEKEQKSVKDILMEQMNGKYLWYRPRDAEVETYRYFSFYKSDTQSHQLLSTKGFDYVFAFSEYSDDKCSETFHGDKLQIDITTDFRNDTCITFKINGESIRINVCDSLQIAQLLSQIDEYGAELPTTTIRHEDERVSLLIEISSLGIRRKPDGSIFMDDVRSTGFVRKKE